MHLLLNVKFHEMQVVIHELSNFKTDSIYVPKRVAGEMNHCNHVNKKLIACLYSGYFDNTFGSYRFGIGQ